jgi:hypothetical protein
MERIPSWALMLAGVILVGLAVWSATDENWAGVIVSLALAAVCLFGLVQRRAPS